MKINCVFICSYLCMRIINNIYAFDNVFQIKYTQLKDKIKKIIGTSYTLGVSKTKAKALNLSFPEGEQKNTL